MKAKVLLCCIFAITFAQSSSYQHINATQNDVHDTYLSQFAVSLDFNPMKFPNKKMKRTLRGLNNAYANETFHYDPYPGLGNNSFGSFFPKYLPYDVLTEIGGGGALNHEEEIIQGLFLKLLSSHQRIPSTHSHQKLLTLNLFKISHAFELLGLINSCSPSSEAHLYELITETLDMFLKQHNTPQSQKSTLANPFNKILQFLGNAKEKSPLCYKKVEEIEKHKNEIEEFMSLIDPDLSKYLSSRIFPLYSILHKVMNNTGLYVSSAHYICDVLNETARENFESCESNVLNTVDFLKDNLLHEDEETKIRTKRSSKLRLGGDMRRDGYDSHGSYGGYDSHYGYDGYHSDGYDDDSYIIIPDDEEKGYKHIYLIKLLAAWAFGAYCLLGLLAYQTYFTSAFDRGYPGLKGPRGPTGDKGIKGNKGMKGPKGMNGVAGPIGLDGDVGMKGMKGMKGPKGNKGPAGPDGPKGNKGPKAGPGATGPAGDKGVMGPVGQKGEKGAEGPKGAPGPQGKRKRRNVETSRNSLFIDLTDSAVLLRSLYVENSIQNEIPTPKQKHVIFAETLNRLWRDFKDPFGCLKCTLFDLLNSSDSAIIDPYIFAGFAHVLGHTEALPLLGHVWRARAAGLGIHCKRKKNTCTLVHSQMS